MSLDLDRLKRAVGSGPVARIVVLRTAGSVPREAGAEMLVWQDRTEGTIGGGALEWEAIAAARDLLIRGGIAERIWPLGPGLGQCCGGSVTTVTEVFTAQNLPRSLPYIRPLRVAAQSGGLMQRLQSLPAQAAPALIDGWLVDTALPHQRDLWIWGAGHVGRALVTVLAPLPDYRLTWVDIAADRFPAEIAENVTPVVAAQPERLVPHAPRTAEHLVLTHSHALDLSLCHALLSHGFASLGLIGSDTKWARFRARLTALGHAADQIGRIVCPIGDPNLGKHPHAIALGVATRLLLRTDSLKDQRTGTP